MVITNNNKQTTKQENQQTRMLIQADTCSTGRDTTHRGTANTHRALSSKEALQLLIRFQHVTYSFLRGDPQSLHGSPAEPPTSQLPFKPSKANGQRRMIPHTAQSEEVLGPLWAETAMCRQSFSQCFLQVLRLRLWVQSPRVGVLRGLGP